MRKENQLPNARGAEDRPKSDLIRLVRNIWHKADGLAVAKACTAFLIGVLIFAVLLSIGLAIFTAAWFG